MGYLQLVSSGVRQIFQWQCQLEPGQVDDLIAYNRWAWVKKRQAGRESWGSKRQFEAIR